MVFEVKATHRVTSTGTVACEVHPGVFVDGAARVFSTVEGMTGTDPDKRVDVEALGRADVAEVFVVEDEAVEVAIDWIRVSAAGDSGARARIEQRSRCRWPLPPGSVTDAVPTFGRLLRQRDTRVTEFEVRASHHISGGGEFVCEVYPHVFVAQRGGVLSRYAGMAMQQPGDFVTELPAGTQQWFRVRGLEGAASWVSTVADIGNDFWLRNHGARSSVFPPLIGPMGPACPARRRLPR